jgi:hypothetical protein
MNTCILSRPLIRSSKFSVCKPLYDMMLDGLDTRLSAYLSIAYIPYYPSTYLTTLSSLISATNHPLTYAHIHPATYLLTYPLIFLILYCTTQG